jgi:hypothetical protein
MLVPPPDIVREGAPPTRQEVDRYFLGTEGADNVLSRPPIAGTSREVLSCTL